ncbi:MAG: sensor histidine kinase [Aureispira sp.]
MNQFTKYLLSKEVYLHLLCWLLYGLLPILQSAPRQYFWMQLLLSNIETPFIIINSYCNLFYLFGAKSKFKFWYIAGLLLLMTMGSVWVSKRIIDVYIYQLEGYTYQAHFISVLGQFLLVNLIFYTLYSIKKSNRLAKSLQVAELNNLKAQIDPHFFINTLNSIYYYTLEDNEKAATLLLKLSNNYKYLWREGANAKVLITEDWEHIQNFIGICQFRWEDKLKFEIKEVIEDHTKLIAPLILMTFVENAVKYTSQLRGAQQINIELRLTAKQLFFYCKNPKSKIFSPSKFSTTTGIGLKNTQQRLMLLYPNTHELLIEETTTTFVVKLTLDL